MVLRLIGSASLSVLLLATNVLALEEEDTKSALDGTTPLHRAVRADDLQKVETLLRAGGNAKAADRYGITPLNLAAVNGNTAMIKKLLDAGADPNAVDLTGETILMTAVR